MQKTSKRYEQGRIRRTGDYKEFAQWLVDAADLPKDERAGISEVIANIDVNYLGTFGGAPSYDVSACFIERIRGIKEDTAVYSYKYNNTDVNKAVDEEELKSDLLETLKSTVAVRNPSLEQKIENNSLIIQF